MIHLRFFFRLIANFRFLFLTHRPWPRSSYRSTIHHSTRTVAGLFFTTPNVCTPIVSNSTVVRHGGTASTEDVRAIAHLCLLWAHG